MPWWRTESFDHLQAAQLFNALIGRHGVCLCVFSIGAGILQCVTNKINTTVIVPLTVGTVSKGSDFWLFCSVCCNKSRSRHEISPAFMSCLFTSLHSVFPQSHAWICTVFTGGAMSDISLYEDRRRKDVCRDFAGVLPCRKFLPEVSLYSCRIDRN